MTNESNNNPTGATAATREITAKFTGKCVKCGFVIPSGTRCKWSKAAGISHLDCLEQSAEARAASMPVVDASENKSVSVTAGVFKKDGRIYVVKPNKLKTRVYAKEIIESPARMTEAGAVADFTTVYRAGVVFQLTEADRWNLADAKDFLTKFSKCIVCGRHLKAAKSVAGSIGPVCAKYFAHSHSCDDKPVVKLEQVKAQAEMDTDDDAKRAKIASDIAAADAEFACGLMTEQQERTIELRNDEDTDEELADDAFAARQKELATLLAQERSTTVTSGEIDEARAILGERYTPHNGFGNSTNLFD